MLKTKDFYLKKVYSMKGKYLGVIQDVSIDFAKAVIVGFTVSNYSIFNKKNFLIIEDVICIDDVIVCKGLTSKKGVPFKCLKYIEVIDVDGKPIGVLEDLVIKDDSINIKGLVISSGIFDKIIKGKEIILPGDCVLGEKFMLYSGCNKIKFRSLPHTMVVNERQTKDI